MMKTLRTVSQIKLKRIRRIASRPQRKRTRTARWMTLRIRSNRVLKVYSLVVAVGCKNEQTVASNTIPNDDGCERPCLDKSAVVIDEETRPPNRWELYRVTSSVKICDSIDFVLATSMHWLSCWKGGHL
ncbi:unnamed protein product [Calypogeia fissa]